MEQLLSRDFDAAIVLAHRHFMAVPRGWAYPRNKLNSFSSIPNFLHIPRASQPLQPHHRFPLSLRKSGSAWTKSHLISAVFPPNLPRTRRYRAQLVTADPAKGMSTIPNAPALFSHDDIQAGTSPIERFCTQFLRKML